MDHRDLINLKRYPVDQYGEVLDDRIAAVQANLAQDGCAVLSGFLTEEGIAALKEEADQTAPLAHCTFNQTNPYFTEDDPNLPKDHPKRRFYDRSNAFVPADKFHTIGALRSVFHAPGFDAFIQNCLQEKHFFRYADPIADAIINLAEAGPGFLWHFDTNNYTVTLAIQNFEIGGEFEYALPFATQTAMRTLMRFHVSSTGHLRRSSGSIYSRETFNCFEGSTVSIVLRPLPDRADVTSPFCPMLSGPIWSRRPSAQSNYTGAFCQFIWNGRGCGQTH